MNIFLLISIPAILIWTVLTNSEYKWTSFVPPALTGLLIAILTCFIKEFFIFYSHIATTNFPAYFAYLAARDSILPLLALYLAFTLLSKDEKDYKIESIVPLALSFYSIYIPYFVLTGKEPQAMFLSVIKPILFISLSFIASAALKNINRFMTDRNTALSVLSIFFFILALLLPSLIEALWYYKLIAASWIFSSIIYAGAAMALIVITRIQHKS